ncbi:hypothetical protein B0H15DRAFT_802033 [Mycena belliarum]|uniref:DUF6535 domain-containing protein n=1 Tax=Mycena belliarum TaxID=1033014 RepID=A0AAD6U5Q8_9AGAR|nr:hypothetical protein B0H15DRAFT_802033 [Mycena belliae]
MPVHSEQSSRQGGDGAPEYEHDIGDGAGERQPSPLPAEPNDRKMQRPPGTNNEATTNWHVNGGTASGARLPDPLPRTRFGLRPPGPGQLYPGGGFKAPTDYRQKYTPDPPLKELHHEARIWHVYNDESAIFDTDMVAEANDSLDILLVFAGLFAGVVTTFVVQTSQALSSNNTVITNSLLLELIALQRAQANGTSLNSVPPADTSFTAARSDVWVNGLWFTSLALTLATALLAVLAKQWLRQYSSFVSGSVRERAFIRQFRYNSFDRWGVRIIIGLLPTLLHVSLFLFLGGLVVFLYSLDRTPARIMVCITAFLIGAYITSTILPIVTIKCPYRTPLSAVLFPLREVVPDIFQLAFRLIALIWVLPYIVVGTVLGGRPPDLVPAMIRRWLRAPQRPWASRKSMSQAEQILIGTDTHMWTRKSINWLATTASDPSAKIILVESLGTLEPPPVGIHTGPPSFVFIKEWDAIKQLLAGEAGALCDDMALGRLIRASMNMPLSDYYRHNTFDAMLDGLPPVTPIDITDDPATILSVAAANSTSRFAWSNQDEVVIRPHEAFQFVLEHYSTFAELGLPAWMWWSICAQAAMGPDGPAEDIYTRQVLYPETLFGICTVGKMNIEQYNMGAWIREQPLPTDLRRAIFEPLYMFPASPLLSLASFIRENLLSELRAASRPLSS